MQRHLSTNKVICWQLTTKCNRSCDFCISKSNPKNKNHKKDLDLIFSRFEELGVEKLSYSGGEPLIHPQLAEAVSHGTKMGIEQILTSNGDYLLSTNRLDSYKAILSQLQYLKLSFYGDEKMHDSYMGKKHYKQLFSLLPKLNEMNITVGANIMLTNYNLKSIDTFIKGCLKNGVHNILITTLMWRQEFVNSEKLQLVSNSELDFLQYQLAKYRGMFSGGIKMHVNNKDSITLVLDDREQIFYGGIKLGSIYDNIIYWNGNEYDMKDLLNIFWSNRLKTEAIVPIA